MTAAEKHVSLPFDAYGRYYDLLYRDKDYVAEVEYVRALLGRHDVAGRELLEFGSGTGKHGRLFAQRGYRVLGIEVAAEMVARAASAPGFETRQADIRTVRLGRTFDAVLSLFHVVSYQTSNADVQAVFARAAEHLSSGGLFIFDVWYTPAVHAQRPQVRVKRLTDQDVSIVRLAEPAIHANENRVDVEYTIIARSTASGACHEFRETHPMRHFCLPELDLFAQTAGFERVAAEEFLSGAAPSESTWGVCVILRKH
jgi:SAM-dependent methyltransferase